MSRRHKLRLRILEGIWMARCFRRRLKAGYVVCFDRIRHSKMEVWHFVAGLNRHVGDEENLRNDGGVRLMSIARILHERKHWAGPAGCPTNG